MSKRKVIIVCLIAVFVIGGGSITLLGNKFTRQEDVNLILAMSSQTSLKKGADCFAKLCSKYSDGKISVDVFPDNILGDDKAVVESAQIGDIDIAISSSSPLAVMYHDYYLFDAPYLFLNKDEVYQIGFEGDAGKKIADGVNQIGLENLAMWENGFRDLTNNSVPVSKPSQLSGMKIRTMENSIHLAAWKAFGANPTPMAFTELFTALQQGTVDGQENPIGLIDSNKFYEVQKYISLTEHVYTPYCVLMNLDRWNSLTKKQQDIIQRAMKEATKVQLKESEDSEETSIKTMEKAGCTVIKLSDEQKQAFQTIIEKAGIFNLVKKNMDNPRYLEEMQSELKTYREKE